MSLARLSDNQLAEVNRRARQIEDVTARDSYFQSVADTLRDVEVIDDRAVRRAASAAFAPYAIDRAPA